MLCASSFMHIIFSLSLSVSQTSFCRKLQKDGGAQDGIINPRVPIPQLQQLSTHGQLLCMYTLPADDLEAGSRIPIITCEHFRMHF